MIIIIAVGRNILQRGAPVVHRVMTSINLPVRSVSALRILHIA